MVIAVREIHHARLLNDWRLSGGNTGLVNIPPDSFAVLQALKAQLIIVFQRPYWPALHTICVIVDEATYERDGQVIAVIVDPHQRPVIIRTRVKRAILRQPRSQRSDNKRPDEASIFFLLAYNTANTFAVAVHSRHRKDVIRCRVNDSTKHVYLIHMDFVFRLNHPTECGVKSERRARESTRTRLKKLEGSLGNANGFLDLRIFRALRTVNTDRSRLVRILTNTDNADIERTHEHSTQLASMVLGFV